MGYKTVSVIMCDVCSKSFFGPHAGNWSQKTLEDECIDMGWTQIVLIPYGAAYLCSKSCAKKYVNSPENFQEEEEF